VVWPCDSFLISVPFWYLHIIMPGSGAGCSGFGAMVFNAAFNLALLCLFINFHQTSYAAPRRKTS
jgi:hypothetical protein